MKKILVLIVLITSFISPLDMTHPTMKTLIQQPSKILTDFQGEDASSTNNILYGKGILYGRDANSSFKFDSLQWDEKPLVNKGIRMNESPIMIAHSKIYKLKAVASSETTFEIVR
jgi:hypothetical protein